ncbi:class I SAM-dependent methyltransferase [Agreia pratensis]|uniref:Methyltransferase domain-containing protein n=1 Tax=Agreia pratensis TaxID=150121 RepID=A0A1X7J958_9MICO|nr:class I SAM-dependent methyltransferase [Agreia pratensis]SMG24341.1 Methyltransferase domain-containing protein [Agreia pratensis]
MTGELPTIEVADAYSGRAAEYIELLGSVEAMHPSDTALIASWGAQIEGPAFDVGCGPGHWTNFLAERGVDIRGVDLTPAFVEHARATYPDVRFATGGVEALDASDASLGGALAWYSLIHHRPDAIGSALDEIARVLRPGGLLLVGFFEGPVLEPFDHAVTTAYRWPAAELGERLRASGLEIVETHTRTSPNTRPHAAIVARRLEL